LGYLGAPLVSVPGDRSNHFITQIKQKKKRRKKPRCHGTWEERNEAVWLRSLLGQEREMEIEGYIVFLVEDRGIVEE